MDQIAVEMQNNFLKTIPFFRKMNPVLLAALFDYMQLHKAEKGEILYRRHDIPSESINISIKIIVIIIKQYIILLKEEQIIMLNIYK